MYKILFILFAFCILTSCFLATKRTPPAFKDVDAKRITGNFMVGSVKEGLNKEVLVKGFELETVLHLPSIQDTVYGIKLDNSPEAMVGSIDKLRLTDDAIYVLDRYGTVSLKKFALDGSFITSIGQRGDGPGEYIQPSDFYVGDSLIIIYDQFKSSLLYYDLSGNFIRNKQVPFFALSFHFFDSNTYLFHAFDSDNYHLPEILNYSLIWTDSTFSVKYVNAYREKDKYDIAISNNNMDLFNGELYYHEPHNDTIFRVSPYGDIYYDFVYAFPENKMPEELVLRKNSRLLEKARSPEATTNYVCISSNPIVARDFLFQLVSINSRSYNIFYSLNANEAIIDAGHYRHNGALLIVPQFFNVLNSNENTLIGYIHSHTLVDRFEYIKNTNWLLDRMEDELIEFAEDVKETDNVIIVFYKLREWR